MKCYIYKIINLITNEKYVGQTTNFNRRKHEHLNKLRLNCHPNPKLQNVWNKYGEDNFNWECAKYDINKSELDNLEVETIQKENSYYKGYNLTPGGTGGNTRINRIISFEQFCFIYAGNLVYDNMCSMTARFIGCDSSTISAIKRGISYDDFRARYEVLDNAIKQQYLDNFIEQFNLNNAEPPKKASRLTDDQVIDFLCLISRYGKGAEIAFLRAVNHAKGLGHHLKTQPDYFINSKIYYNNICNQLLYNICHIN